MFLPGNSTAQATTYISGRGVGMDIVRTDIDALSGSISVWTETGKGSAFTLELPLTLATLRVLPQAADEQTAASPLADVVEPAFVSDGNRAA